MKSAFKSKTIWVAVITVVIGAVTALTDLVPLETQGYVVMVIGALNMLLRFVTDKAVSL